MPDSDYFIVIPARVRLDQSLLPLDKLIYGEILCLSHQTGYCWAQNSTLGEVYGARPETVSRSIRKLQNAGYIQVSFTGKGNSGRRILPLDSDIKVLDSQINTLDLHVKGDDVQIKAPLTSGSSPLDLEIKHNKKRNIQEEHISLFNRFWSAYPRKQGKKTAERAFVKLKPDESLLGEILAALDWQKQSASWTKENGQFIPLPATYLNGRRWEDEKPTTTQPEKNHFLN